MPQAGSIAISRIPMIDITVSDKTGVVDNFSLIGLRIEKNLLEVADPAMRRKILVAIAEDLCMNRISRQFKQEGGYLSSGAWAGYSEGSKRTRPMLIGTTKRLYSHLTSWQRSVGIRIGATGRYGEGWKDDSLTLGFKDVGYGRWHQTGTSKMPQRAIIEFIPKSVLMYWKHMIILPYLRKIQKKM